MKRRSFFTGILHSVAAIAVASSMEVFGPGKEATEIWRFKPLKILNPDYLAAEFEECTALFSDAKEGFSFKRTDHHNDRVSIPIDGRRFDFVNGKWVEVPKYIFTTPVATSIIQ